MNGMGYAGGGYNKMQELEQRLSAIEAGEGEEETMFGKISGLLDNEHIAPVIGKVLESVLSRIMPMPEQAPQISGVPAENTQPGEITGDERAYWVRVQNALIRLKPYIDLPQALEKLAGLAETDSPMFHTLKSFI
jgi:hypothetical protein